jgi:hypothetical protein
MAANAQAPQVNGLKTAWDTIVAPKEAFEAIRAVPTWGWALAIAIVLAVVGNFLLMPAIEHSIVAGWPQTVAQNAQLSQMPADKQQQILDISLKTASFTWIFTIFVVPIICLIEAVVMLVFDKLGHGEGTFAKYFAASCNIAIIGAGIGYVVSGIVAMARGADSFQNQAAVQQAVPSLNLLFHAGGKLGAFFGTFTPFTIWATGLTIAAMLVIGRVPKFQAWLAGAIIFLIPCLLAVAFTK